MKICPHCHEEVENNFDICWNCNYSFPDQEVLDKPWIDDGVEKSLINSLRCNAEMCYSGKFSLHKYNTGLISGLTALLRHQCFFEMYVCPKCRKAECFVPLGK